VNQYVLVDRHLASVPHLAGTAQDLEQAEWMRNKFLEFGLDEASVVPYQVLLSYPNKDKLNKVYLMNETGDAVFTTSGTQTPIYSPEEYSPDAAPNFNAYSAPGTVEVRILLIPL
jgi:N-acetylated-alpha-linked acidic dipeptidase